MKKEKESNFHTDVNYEGEELKEEMELSFSSFFSFLRNEIIYTQKDFIEIIFVLKI